MKVSKYIQILEHLMKEHGDLEVETTRVDFSRKEATKPMIAYRRILKGRESKSCFYSAILDNEDRKGEKVIRI